MADVYYLKYHNISHIIWVSCMSVILPIPSLYSVPFQGQSNKLSAFRLMLEFSAFPRLNLLTNLVFMRKLCWIRMTLLMAYDLSVFGLSTHSASWLSQPHFYRPLSGCFTIDIYICANKMYPWKLSENIQGKQFVDS